MESSHVARIRRQERVRRRLRGSDARPRLSVFRSGRHIYAQVITDQQGHTLLAVSTLTPALRQQGKTSTVDAAKQVGILVAQRCIEHGIKQVVFDRNGFIYHGRVKEVADGARDAGLAF